MNYYELGRDSFISGVEKCPIIIDEKKFSSIEIEQLKVAKIQWWNGWLDARTEKKLGFSKEEWSSKNYKKKPIINGFGDRFNVYKNIDWP